MKYCVHVTVTGSVEVEASSQLEAKRKALQSISLKGGSQFAESATVFEVYATPKPAIKGRGSY
jgi:hypothetical protein